jgi:hypothetical protein
MPTQPYYVDGKRVPSVTTILSRFKESGALMYWAWDQGRLGKDYRETTKKAGDAGTLCHAMIEADIRGHPVEYPPEVPPGVLENALHAFKAFQEWKSRSRMRVEKTEMPLISTKHLFGGTLDAMMVHDKLILGDWKTSGGIYVDMLIQVAGGYSLLWEENFPDQKLHGVEILRISKPEENGDPISFSDSFWGPEVIPLAQKQFLLLLEAYYGDKRLKGML